MAEPIVRHEIEEIGAMGSEPLTRLYDYWCSIRRGDAIPLWADFDMMAVYDLAPFICVKDAAPDGADFRYRYWGTGMTDKLGYDLSGQWASEFYHGEKLKLMVDDQMAVLKAGRPQLSTGHVIWQQNREHVSYVAMFLPLDGAARPLEHLLLSFDFEVK